MKYRSNRVAPTIYKDLKTGWMGYRDYKAPIQSSRYDSTYIK